MLFTDNALDCINQWIDTHDFSILEHWLEESSSKGLLQQFESYCRQHFRDIDRMYQEKYVQENESYRPNSIDWDYKLRAYIREYKTKIFNKFKKYCITNFIDYYTAYDNTEFNNIVEEEFLRIAAEQLPTLSATDFNTFMAGKFNTNELIYEAIKDKLQLEKFNKWDVINVIYYLIKKLIIKHKSELLEKRRKDVKKIDQICKRIIKNIKQNFNTFITKVKFSKQENGTYVFTQDDVNFDGTSDNNAIEIIEYICAHRSLLQQLAELEDLNKFEKEYNIKLSKYFYDFYLKKDNYDQQLQNLARDYILELAKQVMNKRVLRLENLQDDNKIGKLSISINYNPYNDTERSAPVIIVKNDTISKVLIGNFGESHSSLQRRNEKQIFKITNRKACYAYLVGRVLFISQRVINVCNFTIDEIIAAVKKDGRIIKIYELPHSFPGRIRRLANRLL